MRYGVLPSYLPMFERAAIETLREFLGDLWNDELERAWSTALRAVVTLMQQGISQAPAPVRSSQDRRLGPAARAAFTLRAGLPWYRRAAQAF